MCAHVFNTYNNQYDLISNLLILAVQINNAGPSVPISRSILFMDLYLRLAISSTIHINVRCYARRDFLYGFDNMIDRHTRRCIVYRVHQRS